MNLYDKLLQEVIGQEWNLEDEVLVSFQKFNSDQILLLNQSGKILRVLDKITSFAVFTDNIEIHFEDADGYDDYFTITKPEIEN